MLKQVDIRPLAPERFTEVLADPEPFVAAIAEAKQSLDGRTIWNVNSTGRGGGVAEMLRSLLAYARGADVDARWAVIEGDPDFFRVTKRIHNNLHGSEGDGGALGPDEQKVYDSTTDRNARELAGTVGPNDVVILHDPQTAGLAKILKAEGVPVIWRCHVGIDEPNEVAVRAWDFLRPHLDGVDTYVFSRKAFVWRDLPDERIEIIAPVIDAFSAKNQELSPEQVAGILAAAKIQDGDGGAATFTRFDGSEGAIERQAETAGAGILPPDTRYVLQVSRWDRLKDPVGVMTGFAEHVAPVTDAHLVLAGPSVKDVADDPEGAEVLEEVESAWGRLTDDIAERIHLVTLPMDDGEENAAMVNALQRGATVVVQKSLAEGFGLTVAEAMWKTRPVVASRIGGIQDQIEDGRCGYLVDPEDLTAYGNRVRELLEDESRRRSMGAAAYERVREGFLGPRSLMQYLELIRRLSR